MKYEVHYRVHKGTLYQSSALRTQNDVKKNLTGGDWRYITAVKTIDTEQMSSRADRV